MQKNLLVCILSTFTVALPFMSLSQKKETKFIKNQVAKAPWIELNAGCDTTGWPPPDDYTLNLFEAINNGGFISGNNRFGDKAKANYLDLSGTTATLLLRAIIGVGLANSRVGGDLTKLVPVKVWDGTSGSPGGEIGSLNLTLGEMNQREGFSIFTFPVPITLPASKKIFLGVDISNLSWTVPNPVNPAINDTFAIFHTDEDEPDVPLAWEQFSNNAWFPYSSATSWELNVSHFIYPLVGTSATGCNTLPVTFGRFTAEQNSLGVQLSWQTYNETNSDRFEVQKSNDGQKFLTIGSVKSKAINGEHQGLKSYQFNDPSPIAGANFYRIRQVDKDGAYTFTKTVKVTINTGDDNQMVHTYYPNPAHDRMYIQLATGIREVQSIRFMDASGKILTSLKPAVTPDGLMNIPTNGLRSGLHFATITFPDGKQTTIKVIKE